MDCWSTPNVHCVETCFLWKGNAYNDIEDLPTSSTTGMEAPGDKFQTSRRWFRMGEKSYTSSLYNWNPGAAKAMGRGRLIGRGRAGTGGDRRGEQRSPQNRIDLIFFLCVLPVSKVYDDFLVCQSWSV